ncbi:diacylglycerol/lipid kinase family protein [Taibaiella chishuiensis]|uniref:YegS/Rv2252/BmrU family lipid kinase n=1 Tax=Taibaiella chishuiensis TaxID=1434707 RepID=A0A2P8DD09_9BACT|nr:diacylglycerol kinase family protein [Taibaiella chishuiensis]PSK95113.1 YegS/Rv2252/BmrU family lipid kinase [Taibaiella chishuiensis]
MEKILFIINPKSGVDRVKALKDLIDKQLDKNLFDPEIAYTEYAKHGTELARNAVANGYKTIVAVGGDGSVNDVITGIQGTDATLCIIPKGSGNGLARTLGIPLDQSRAIALINTGKRIHIDLGKVNDRIFVSNVGVGFDTLVAKKFAKSERRGMAIYSWIVTKHLWTYKEWEWEIEVDGKVLQEKAFILTVANAQQFGYNFKIAPTADLQDGLFDVVIIKKFPKILGSYIALRAFNGSLLKSKYVKHLRGKRVTIRHPKLTILQTDGDVHACGNELKVEMMPAALRVMIPA